MGRASLGRWKPATVRTLWGIAKSPELSLSDEELHLLVERETGKDSLRALSQRELDNVARILQGMKDGVRREDMRRRTDEGGNPQTVHLRKKIYALSVQLGWQKDSRRINGMAKRVCGVDRVEWLTVMQCIQLIEALKAMIERQKKEEEKTYAKEN